MQTPWVHGIMLINDLKLTYSSAFSCCNRGSGDRYIIISVSKGHPLVWQHAACFFSQQRNVISFKDARKLSR